jgi:predicted MFS family arabinose efflux permease
VKAQSSAPHDDFRKVLASILMAKAAVATFSIAPFLIGGYIDRLGLTPALASRVLSAEIIALAVSNAMGYFWLRKVDHRSLAQRILLLLIALNISCIFTNDYSMLLAQRAAIGALEGALMTIGFGLLGLTRKPERNFGLYFAISLTIGAINVRILPWFLEAGGIPGLFANLSLYAVIAFVGSFWLPRKVSHEAGMREEYAPQSSPIVPAIAMTLTPLVLLLAANYIYFIGQGGVWSFLERLGQQNQLPIDAIAAALSASLMAGVAGGFSASWLNVKIGRMIPIVFAICCSIAALLILWNSPTPFAFLIAACLFNFGNNFGHPYTLGLTSKIDRTGRLTVLAGALHTGGQATGPFIVGMIVVAPDFTNALWVGLLAFTLTPFMIAPAVIADWRNLRKQKPS